MTQRVLRAGLALILLGACQAAQGDDESAQLCLLSDGALDRLLYARDGVPDVPALPSDAALGEEICRRVMLGNMRDWGDGVFWLTEQQLRRLGSDGGEAGLRLVAEVRKRTGWLLQGEVGRTQQLPRDVAPWPNENDVPVAAITAERIASEIADGAVLWPNDGGTRWARLELAHEPRIVEALREAVRVSHDAMLPYWASAALIRMGRWDGSALRARSLEYDWNALESYFPRIGNRAAAWTVFRETLAGASSVRDRLLAEIRSGRTSPDAMLGHLTATGESAVRGLEFYESRVLEDISEPAWHDLLDGRNARLIIELLTIGGRALNDKVGRLHLEGEVRPDEIAALRALSSRSVAALAILAERGDEQAGLDLFWGVDAGVIAARSVMDGELANAVWKSGAATRLLLLCHQRGGVWAHMAQAFIAETGAPVWGWERDEFVAVLGAVLRRANGVVCRWSPLCDRWVLLPTR